MDYLNDLLQWLDKIQGLSAGALVLFSAIVVGYCLKFIKTFPNQAIPIVVILWSAIAMLFIADPRATTMPARVWSTRNLLTGLIDGLLAWLLHNLVLSKVEDWLAAKFPDLGNTNFFKKKNGEDPTEPPNV